MNANTDDNLAANMGKKLTTWQRKGGKVSYLAWTFDSRSAKEEAEVELQEKQGQYQIGGLCVEGQCLMWYCNTLLSTTLCLSHSITVRGCY